MCCDFTVTQGLLTWREEDPSTMKILEGGTTFHLLYMLKFRPKWLSSREGKEENCRPITAERPAAAMFVLFVPITRIFRAKVVYMVLGSSYLSARKILAPGPSTRLFACKLNRENIWR